MQLFFLYIVSVCLSAELIYVRVKSIAERNSTLIKGLVWSINIDDNKFTLFSSFIMLSRLDLSFQFHCKIIHKLPFLHQTVELCCFKIKRKLLKYLLVLHILIFKN